MINCYDFDYVQYRNYSFKIYDISLNELCRYRKFFYKNAIAIAYVIDSSDIECFQYYQQDIIYDSESIAMAHPANLTSGSYYYQVNTLPLRIRKLTPKECFRLMGFSDEDFSKAEQVPTSNAQLYKQAGNSIVVNVLEEMLKELFINEKKPKRQTDQTRYEQLTLF